jgi:hypothetical protein
MEVAMAALTAHPYLPRLGRRPGPADRTRPALDKGERVLVRERDARTRQRVVATAHAVYYQDHANGLRSWQRLGWEQVERADWYPERGELRLVGTEPAVPDLTLHPGRPAPLLGLARERITATTVARLPVHRAGRAVGHVIARRPDTGEREVTWVVRLGPGVELTDAELADALRTARAHLGI